MRLASLVSPRRSTRLFCSLGSSISSHFSMAEPVNSRIVSLADLRNSSFNATSYSCMHSPPPHSPGMLTAHEPKILYHIGLTHLQQLVETLVGVSASSLKRRVE